jgi:hypothetical protein
LEKVTAWGSEPLGPAVEREPLQKTKVLSLESELEPVKILITERPDNQAPF